VKEGRINNAIDGYMMIVTADLMQDQVEVAGLFTGEPRVPHQHVHDNPPRFLWQHRDNQGQ
jgi:hypothetical protein